jgi:hypothetical protein
MCSAVENPSNCLASNKSYLQTSIIAPNQYIANNIGTSFYNSQPTRVDKAENSGYAFARVVENANTHSGECVQWKLEVSVVKGTGQVETYNRLFAVPEEPVHSSFYRDMRLDDGPNDRCSNSYLYQTYIPVIKGVQALDNGLFSIYVYVNPLYRGYDQSLVRRWFNWNFITQYSLRISDGSFEHQGYYGRGENNYIPNINPILATSGSSIVALSQDGPDHKFVRVALKTSTGESSSVHSWIQPADIGFSFDLNNYTNVRNQFTNRLVGNSRTLQPYISKGEFAKIVWGTPGSTNIIPFASGLSVLEENSVPSTNQKVVRIGDIYYLVQLYNADSGGQKINIVSFDVNGNKLNAYQSSVLDTRYIFKGVRTVRDNGQPGIGIMLEPNAGIKYARVLYFDLVNEIYSDTVQTISPRLVNYKYEDGGADGEGLMLWSEFSGNDWYSLFGAGADSVEVNP